MKRRPVCSAASQQSVCIKSFPVAFLKHRLALDFDVRHSEGTGGIDERVFEFEVGIFKNAATTVNTKEKLQKHLALISWRRTYGVRAHKSCLWMCVYEREFVSVCVCAYVCEAERSRGKSGSVLRVLFGVF